MVQGIERLEPELKLDSSGENEVLEQRKIKVVHSGTALRVAPERTELSLPRLCKRGRVEPSVYGSLAAVRVANEIRSVRAERVVEPTTIGRRDRQREPALPRVDAIDLPAADDGVLDAGRITGELLAAAERQIVDEAPDEAVIDVEVRQGMVAFGIRVVEETLPP